MRRFAAIALALALLGADATGTAARIRGTRVLLEVPPGFRLSDEFPGLGRDEDLTSVLVTELAMPIDAAREAFSREALEEQGVMLHREDPVHVGSYDGTLLHATQRAAGTTFRKWLLLTGDGSASVLITATTPLDLESVHQEALVGVLRSARWDPAQPASAEEELRFRIVEAPPFEIVTAAPNAIVLAIPGTATTDGEVEPLIAVGSSLGRVHIANLPAFTRDRLAETASIDEVEIRSQRETTLGGLPAYAVSADARDIASGRPVRVQHILATDGERYYLLQGIFDVARSGTLDAAFERIAASFATQAMP